MTFQIFRVRQNTKAYNVALGRIQPAADYLKFRSGKFGQQVIPGLEAVLPGFGSGPIGGWPGGIGGGAVDAFRKWNRLKQQGIIDDNGLLLGPAPTLVGPSGSVLPPPLPTPTGQFRKLRFSNTHWAGFPVAGPQNQPLQEIVNSVNLTTNETNVSYRWEGYFRFDPASYDFSAETTNGFRLTVAGDRLIDGVALSAQRTLTQQKVMPAGLSLVVVEWFNPSNLGSVTLNIARTPLQSWKSCADGISRPGAPPPGWTQIAAGCWQAPTDATKGNTEVDLTKIIQIAPGPNGKIERTYQLGSGAEQDPHSLRFFNCSTNTTVDVALTGPEMVLFVTSFQTVGNVGIGGLPANRFPLAPRTEMLVDVMFRPDRMEALPEGVSASQIFVSLTAEENEQILQVGLCEGLIPTPIPTSSLPDPSIQPPILHWNDCSSGTLISQPGTPPTGWILRADGCYVPPSPITPTIVLDFTFSPSPTTFSLFDRVSGQVRLRARLSANISGDDSSTYTYRWNFDVLGQGAGTGQTNVQTPTEVVWTVTPKDIGGLVTRTIEVIATKGTTVLRTRKQVVFVNATAPTVSGGSGGGSVATRVELI